MPYLYHFNSKHACMFPTVKLRSLSPFVRPSCILQHCDAGIHCNTSITPFSSWPCTCVAGRNAPLSGGCLGPLQLHIRIFSSPVQLRVMVWQMVTLLYVCMYVCYCVRCLLSRERWCLVLVWAVVAPLVACRPTGRGFACLDVLVASRHCIGLPSCREAGIKI